MELFLNLCWLSLLVPACLLWRRRTSSAGSDGQAGSTTTPTLVFLCTLGCVFVLLFPVISASDDLHAMRPEMEESERAFRGANRCACTLHGLTHHALTRSWQPFLPASASLTPAFEQIGEVLPFMQRTIGIFSASVPAARAPPSEHPTSV
jgi:hypothetical protein